MWRCIIVLRKLSIQFQRTTIVQMDSESKFLLSLWIDWEKTLALSKRKLDGEWMKSMCKCTAREETDAVGENVHSIFSFFQAEAQLNSSVLYCYNQKKSNFVICWMFSIEKDERTCLLRIQGVDRKTGEHLKDGQDEDACDKIWNNLEVIHTSQLPICILYVSMENSQIMAKCPNTKDHPQSVYYLNLKSNF